MDTATKIGIVGGGVEGVALAQYLKRKGFSSVQIFDEKNVAPDVPAGIEMVLGPDAFTKMYECQVLFRSPGIHTNRLDSARKKGITVTSTTQYFFENCPCRIVGVTGTKGKGTTATLIHLMLKEAGFDAYLGGNIGESPLNFIDALSKDSIVVLELSSFQLQDLKMSPHVAVVVMTTTEHMDYHKDVAEYRDAKSSIVRFQKPEDFAVLNKDYAYTEEFAKLTPAKKLFVSTKESSGDGSHIMGPKIVNCIGVKCEMIGDTAKVALPGKHNLENVVAAVAAARALDVPIPAVQKIVYTFAGLPHRLELIREKDGVKYYNDSFSTTPETSVAASYAFNGPVILIAGGSEKKSDYTEWGMELQKNKNLKLVILMGVTADRMEIDLRSAAEKLNAEFPLKIHRAGSLDEALKVAGENTASGDYVVLSPAAASFDMFKNYKERGERFRSLVNDL